MSALFDVVETLFAENGWDAEKIPGAEALAAPFSGENGTYDAFAEALDGGRFFVFRVVLPVAASETHIPGLAALVCLANYGLLVGNFELDLSDGEVRFKSGVDFEDAPPTAPLVRNAIITALVTADRYMPAFAALVEEGVSPVDAVGAVEGPDMAQG